MIPDALIDALFAKGSCESRQTMARVLRNVTSPQTCSTVHTGIRRVALRGLYHLTCSPDKSWSTDASESIYFIHTGRSILTGVLHALIDIGLIDSDEEYENGL